MNLIEVVIRADDQASSVLRGITGSLDSMGTNLIKAGGLLSAITAPIAGVFAFAVNAASEQQQAMSQLEAVLRSTGNAAGVTADQALELSESLAKVTRFGDDTILAAENILLTFTKVGKDVFPDAVRAALDLSTALGTDLNSATLQIGKALNDPIAGLTALSRAGVQFTDTQKAMIESMVEAGDVMGAQRVILEELNKQVGGSAEAAGRTFAGRIDIIKNKLGELAERIGFVVLPILERGVEIIDSVIDRITEWADKNPALVRTIVLIGGALVTLGPALILVGTALKGISAVVGLITPAISLLGTALGLLASPIGLVVAGAAVLATVLGVDLAGGVQAVLDNVGKLPIAFEDGSGALANILQGFGMGEEAAMGFGRAVYQVISFIEAVVMALQGDLTGAIETFGDALQQPAALEGFATFLFNAGNAVREFIAGFQVNVGLIPFYFDYAARKVASAIQTNIVDPLVGIWRIVEPYVQDIVDWFNVEFYNALVSVGTWVLTNVIVPLQDIYTQVEPYLTLLGSLFDVVMARVSVAIQPVITFITDLVAGLDALWAMLGRIGSGNFVKPPEVKPPTNPGGFPPLLDPWGNIIGTGMGNLPYQLRDWGGRGVAGMPYLIGTGAQPELFVPDSAGSFYPRGGMGGGVTVQGDVNLNFPNVTDQTRVEAFRQIVIDTLAGLGDDDG